MIYSGSKESALQSPECPTPEPAQSRAQRRHVILPSRPFDLLGSWGYLLPALAAGKSGEDSEPPTRTLWSCGMLQAISCIMEFPLCFLGEINRKNIVPNSMTHCLALPAPAAPTQAAAQSSAALRGVWDLGMCCMEPQAAEKDWTCAPSSSTHLSQAWLIPNHFLPSFQPHS